MIVLDTGLIFAAFNEDDPNHQTARSIFKRIYDGDYSQPIIIDYVYNELLTLTYIRTKRFDLVIKLSDIITDFIEKKNITFVHTPSEVYWKANEIFMGQEIDKNRKFLSFTDAIIGSMSIWLNAPYMGTFDSQFHRFSVQIISE
jgi:predicted nucleic acid-binding protein